MLTADKTLLILGAAEGSYYSVPKGANDVRYAASFANSNSGLSFGICQFDVATNTQGQAGFRQILGKGVESAAISEEQSKRIYAAASTRNAKAKFTAGDLKATNDLLATPAAKSVIDILDRQRSGTETTHINLMINAAATHWKAKKVTYMASVTQGEADCLHLCAYLLACLNRFPANKDTFQKWLHGSNVKTKNGPPNGFTLKAPPTISEMHAFFKSLRIWDGTQGNYQYLRDRLDPTLARITP